MKKKNKSWLENKIQDSKFRKGLEEELEKLSISEQIVRLRVQAGMTQAQLAKKIVHHRTSRSDGLEVFEI